MSSTLDLHREGQAQVARWTHSTIVIVHFRTDYQSYNQICQYRGITSQQQKFPQLYEFAEIKAL